MMLKTHNIYLVDIFVANGYDSIITNLLNQKVSAFEEAY